MKESVKVSKDEESTTWKINQTPPKVELPKITKGNLTFNGKKLTKIVFQKEGDTISWSDKDITLYPRFEKAGKGKKKKKTKKAKKG